MAMVSDYTFAYQPIVDVARRAVASFEALVRGPNNESAHWVMDQLSPEELRQFDLDARLRAIALAAELQLPCHINLNLLPDSLEAAGSVALASTVDMATLSGLRPDQLVLEVSEREVVTNPGGFVARANQCRKLGVRFAIDDFGAGYSGLNLLAEFQPEAIKLDMLLVRDIGSKGPRQAIVRGVLRTCEDLGIEVVAEGVETIDEYQWLHGEGIDLFQGYLFARPAFQRLPAVHYPD
jgi:EAL domain-containing protein (putative c-di-GMP-specific phosphodiesterase class I)